MPYRQPCRQHPSVDGKPVEICVCESSNGIRCTYYAVRGSQFCIFHHPWHLVGPKELKELADRGEVVTADELSDIYHPLRLVDSDDLLAFAEYQLRELMAQENSVERNRLIRMLVETAIEIHERRQQEVFEKERAETELEFAGQVTLGHLRRRGRGSPRIDWELPEEWEADRNCSKYY